MKEASLSEKLGIKADVPADINTTGLTGSRVDLSKGYKLAVCINVASAAADLDVTLQQHDAASGGNSKALAISNAYFVKVGAATKFTKKELSSVSNIVDADFNGAAGIMVVEVNAEDLDVNGDFRWVSCNIADPAAARVASQVYKLHNLRELPAYDQDL